MLGRCDLTLAADLAWGWNEQIELMKISTMYDERRFGRISMARL